MGVEEEVFSMKLTYEERKLLLHEFFLFFMPNKKAITFSRFYGTCFFPINVTT